MEEAHPPLSRSVEDYLKAIFSITERGRSGVDKLDRRRA